MEYAKNVKMSKSSSFPLEDVIIELSTDVSGGKKLSLKISFIYLVSVQN